MTMQDIIDDIDAATDPDRMTKKEAFEFLQRLSTEIESRMEALKEELRETFRSRHTKR